MSSEKFYNSRHIAALFNVTTETVRVWSEEFARHFSPTATPGKGRHRSFSEDDLEIFALVAELKAQGLTFNDIQVALSNGQRGTPPNIPASEVQAIMLNEQEKRLTLEVDYLRKTLTKVEQERDNALQRLEEAMQVKEQNIRLQVELEYSKQRVSELKIEMEELVRNRVQEVRGDFDGRIHDLMNQLNDSQQRILELSNERSKLEREVGESYVKGVMETLERKGDLPRRDLNNG
jgi:DNA-binding transcriptional MerR regulator